MMKISVVIPTLNEANVIVDTLIQLQPLRTRGHEIIISDGGSADNTIALASPLVDQIIQSAKGRARQMNAGARNASGNILWFLHADTEPLINSDQIISEIMFDSNIIWGRFNVRLSGHHWFLRVVEFLINIRSCITSIATGDQGIFVRRNVFERLKGFAEIALMEDIDFSRQCKKLSRPVCIKHKLITSSRRWEENGIIKTIFLMWRLRLAYYFGSSPEILARKYHTNNYLFPDAKLIIFSKAPIPGQVKTRLIPALGKKAATHLHQSMLEQTIRLAQKSTLAPIDLYCAPDKNHAFFKYLAGLYAINLKTQKGADLGKKMQHAIKKELKTSQSVVIIGTDCPALTTHYLQQAFQKLRTGRNDIVIGPAEDGGYVLIGANRVDSKLFRAIDWGTEKVYKQTIMRLNQLGWTHHNLDVLWDIDTPGDLHRLPEYYLNNSRPE